jgi:putative restriction endonuclease
MRFHVGVTDNAWFRFLAERRPDEVNFWQPSDNRAFRAIQPGAPFLFKLHSPLNYIVGGGFFVRHSILPLSFAWQAFGEKNGAADYATFAESIRAYRARTERERQPDPRIGCLILSEPFFLDEEDWVPSPPDWSANIVQGKTYETAEPVGASLWQEVTMALVSAEAREVWQPAAPLVAESGARYGSEYLVRPRLGQGGFRVVVTEAYHRRCAVTGEKVLPVLEAAHIKPYGESGPHRVENGILLRADLHALFDGGYMTVTPDMHVEVSRRIHDDYDNGEEYLAPAWPAIGGHAGADGGAPVGGVCALAQ